METKERVKVSWFSGVSIEMCFDGHSVPHFHAVAEFEGDSAVYGLDGSLLQGSLPSWGLEDVGEWVSRRAVELRKAWDQCQSGESPFYIRSLDDDGDELVEPGKLLPAPVEVEARDGFRIWVRFDNGVSGEIDLSDLVGKGVFKAWGEPAFFSGVYVSPHSSIAWNEDIEICPDAAYMEVTGLTVEEMFPDLVETPVDA